MIKKILTPIFSLGVVFCVAHSLVLARSQEQQWRYVSEVIQIQEREQETLLSKLGSCLNDHALLLAIPVGVLSTLQGATASRYLALLSNNPETNFFLGGIIGGTLGSLLSSGIFKVVGTLLQGRPALCKQILTAFIAEWKTHKKNTPEALHPMFDSIYIDFIKNGELIHSDAQKACQIIESLLAASMVFTTAQ